MADECLDLSEALKSSEEMQGGSCAGARQLELLHHAYSVGLDLLREFWNKAMIDCTSFSRDWGNFLN